MTRALDPGFAGCICVTLAKLLNWSVLSLAPIKWGSQLSTYHCVVMSTECVNIHKVFEIGHDLSKTQGPCRVKSSVRGREQVGFVQSPRLYLTVLLPLQVTHLCLGIA